MAETGAYKMAPTVHGHWSPWAATHHPVVQIEEFAGIPDIPVRRRHKPIGSIKTSRSELVSTFEASPSIISICGADRVDASHFHSRPSRSSTLTIYRTTQRRLPSMIASREMLGRVMLMPVQIVRQGHQRTRRAPSKFLGTDTTMLYLPIHLRLLKAAPGRLLMRPRPPQLLQRHQSLQLRPGTPARRVGCTRCRRRPGPVPPPLHFPPRPTSVHSSASIQRS